MDLPDTRVVIAGDWHGDRSWATTAFAAIAAQERGIQTLLHVGDFYPSAHPLEGGRAWLHHVDELSCAAGIQRVLVTLGNHEPWPMLEPLISPGAPMQVSASVWVLPRPYRLTIGGRQVLSLGGAASVDRDRRQEGVTWFPEEEITDRHVQDAIAGGPADLMLTHDSPDRTPVRAVASVLRRKSPWPPDALVASSRSRARVTEVWDAVFPELLVHGHMHEPGGGRMPDGRRVSSLGANGQWGNLLALDTVTLNGDIVATARS